MKIVSENFRRGAVSNVIGTKIHRTIKELKLETMTHTVEKEKYPMT